MTYDQYIINSKELYHHGIKGQRWHIRRYQNEDGSLTDAGKKRYAKKLIKEYRSDNWDPAFPQSNRVTYDKDIDPKIKSALSKERKAEVLRAKKIFDRAYDEGQRANDELDSLANEYAKSMDPRDAYIKSAKDRPDLVRKSNAVEEYLYDYLDVCGRVAEDILGKYADMPIYDRGKPYAHTLRDDIASKVYTMALKGEINMDRKIR